MGKGNALKQNRLTYTFGFSALLFIAVFFAFPVFFTLIKAEGLFKPLKNDYYRGITLFSLKQAALSTLLSLAIGLPAAWLVAKREFVGRRFLKAVSAIPFALPSIVVVLGFVIFYGNSGFISKILGHSPGIIYNFSGVLLAHTFYNFPVIMNVVSSYWETLNSNREFAARSLGAGAARTFISVTLPRLLLPVLSSMLLVFLYCFGSFAIILVLGGGPDFSTLEVEIYRYSRITTDIPRAASLAIISLMINIIILILYSLIQKKNRTAGNPNPPMRKAAVTFAGKILTYIFVIILILFILAPILSVAAYSFTAAATRGGQGTFSTAQYARISPAAVKNSLIIALFSALISILLALSLGKLIALTKSTALEIIAMSPLAVSSVIIGLSYFFIKMNLNIRSPMLLIITAHSLLALPFSLRTLLPALQDEGRNQLNAAKTMGCSPIKAFFSIELPSIRSQLLTAFIFAFAMSAGEVSATLTLSDGTVATIPVEIYRAISSYNYRLAAAFASVLILLSALVFTVKELKWRSN